MRVIPMTLALPLLLAACSSAGLPSSPAPTGGAVTFTVKAPPAAFSDKGPLKLTVWDAEQLAISEKTANCSVSMSADGKETVNCPPGVTYQKATPEEVEVTKAQIAAGFTFTSKTVAVGERYRLAIGGKASDDCNSAGGSAEGVAGGANLNLEIKEIAQTAMACIPADQVPGAAGGAAGGIQLANSVTFTVTVDRTQFSNKKQITVGIYDPTGAPPEETIVSYEDLSKPLTIKSSAIQVGEQWELRVSGTAADDCNSASGTAQGTATKDAEAVSITQVATTKMACVK